MTREEEIQKIAHELAQKAFPDEHNIWARKNIEAQKTESCCIAIAKWADEHPRKGMVDIDKVCKYLWEDNYSKEQIEKLRKAMEE